VNQRVAVLQLGELGYTADRVANGREVLAALRRVDYDLIFMDCQMPELDGYETAREIRRREGGARHTPIVAVTANTLDEERAKCVAAGMDDYVSKPVRPEELRGVLDRWLPRSGEPGDAVPTTPETDASPLDESHLTELVGGDPHDILDLVELYLRDTSARVTELREALRNRSAEDVGRIAHACAGASAACGMTAIVPVFQELERLGCQGEIEGAERVQPEVERQLRRIRDHLESRRAAALPQGGPS